MTRPDILNFLYTDLVNVANIGIKYQKLLKKLLGPKVIDLLFHLPTSYIDRRNMPPVYEMENGQIVTTIVRINGYEGLDKHKYNKKSPIKVFCSNETGEIELVFFNSSPDYIRKFLPIGAKRIVSGNIEKYAGYTKMIHPDYILYEKQLNNINSIEANYPLTAGLYQNIIVNLIKSILDKVPDFEEWHDSSLIQKYNWPSFKEAITRIHAPLDLDISSIADPARLRLAYDELLASQLAIKLARQKFSYLKGEEIKGDGSLVGALIKKLPFTLTMGQKQVLNEIFADQKKAHSMLRLLQGDVGSGKTLVALIAMLNVVEIKKQAALMVPTEILAKQHYKWISEILAEIPVKVALLTASSKKKEEIFTDLSAGNIDIIIGTHALIGDKVKFKDIGLVVIDEQHRFGVDQRMVFSNKGKNIDTLLMTATPIPRTLALAYYGDVQNSLLKEKPAGRKYIDTKIISVKKIAELMASFSRVMAKGEKIYWICPLIEQSEKLALKDATSRFDELSKIYPGKVALLHGKVPAKDREQIMNEFKNGNIDILVATTVVEVGVDVKDATVIVIEHAERFGIAQLHQLRGRVGRSDKQSSCILLYDKLGATSLKRLQALRSSNDGFYLAEADLDLRGSGDLLGVKQSGMQDFTFADIALHKNLLELAHKEAQLILHNDPKLNSERGMKLRLLLHLFNYGEQINYLRA